MKRIVALLLILAMSAMLFSCGKAPATFETAESTSALSTTKNPDVPVQSAVSPYADIDFFGGKIEDKNGKITLEMQPTALLESVFVEEKIVELIADKLCKKKEQVTMTARLVEDLGADSLDVVELIMAFEDEFGVSLPDEDIASMKTVGDIVNYISKLKK